ncbi:hypothetical protein V6N12_054852 [Hibiscus sabdariffa]|uniref:Uncharacterized protein n=1 Tax=Hibiscus sabdariffa TaxID=183260 RepID=A0ABR2D1M3_9ROSI
MNKPSITDFFVTSTGYPSSHLGSQHRKTLQLGKTLGFRIEGNENETIRDLALLEVGISLFGVVDDGVVLYYGYSCDRVDWGP